MPYRIVPVLIFTSILACIALPALAQTTAASAKHGSTVKLSHNDLFKTVMAAQTACPEDIIVWSTLSKSKSFHLASSRYYGKTHHGAYLCEKTALAAGFHQAKS